MIAHSKPTLNGEDFSAVEEVLRSGNIAQGAKVVQLEESVSLKKENKGKTRLVEKSVWDEKTLPPEVYKDGFYNAGAVSGLIIGTLKQIIAKVEALEQKI